MDPRRLAKERSIAYHGAIAERLQRQPEVLANARQRVQTWLSAGPEAPFYARRWAEILAGDLPSIAEFLTERSELAEELRQSSPFAGALNPQERWILWRETRERLERQTVTRQKETDKDEKDCKDDKDHKDKGLPDL